jgi:DNA replication protein DnaC
MTVVDTALRQALRTLKLSGMLETLDARLTQARAGQLDHLDFLQVLCHDEISRRDTQAITRRLRRARFDQTTTLEEFDFHASPKLPTAQIRDLAALRWLHASESVILYGPVGVGKSHIAQALGHLAIRHGADVRFAKTSRVLADLAGGHADGTWGRRLRELAQPTVLILDDFGMRELTPQQADDLYELTNERARPIADLDQQPVTRRLIPTVPQPHRRRITARPPDQHQPPSVHERTQLPTQQATRPECHQRQQGGHQVEHHQDPPPAELRERRPRELHERPHSTSATPLTPRQGWPASSNATPSRRNSHDFFETAPRTLPPAPTACRQEECARCFPGSSDWVLGWQVAL